MNLHNGFAVFFVLTSVFCLVAGAAESVQQDPQFQALQAHLRECRTEADFLERYKTPLWREEREGGIIECGWAWDGFLFLMGCHDGCTGFSAGISKVPVLFQPLNVYPSAVAGSATVTLAPYLYSFS